MPDGIKVNARSSGNILADVIQVLDSGTLRPAVGRRVEGPWVQILLTDGQLAWVNSEVVIITEMVIRKLPVIEDAVPEVASTPVVTPTPAPVQAAEPPKNEPIRHIIKPNDNLWSLALRYYGDGRFWPLIYENNREVIGDVPTSLTVGTELVIPVLPTLGKDELLALAATVRR